MADAGGIRAGKAFVELFVQDHLTRGLDVAAKKLKAFGTNITDIGKKTLAIGSAITAPLLIAAQQFGAMGHEIQDAAERTGLSTKAVQQLQYAARQTGAEFEDVETAVKKLQKTIFEAAGGSGTARKALAGIGLTFKDLKDLKPEDQLALVGRHLSSVTDAAARTAVAMEIFGKSGTKVLPMLAQLDQQKAKLESLGTVFSDDDIKLATQFDHAISDVWTQLKAITYQIGAAVAQALLPFADSVEKILHSVIDFAKENRGLTFTILTVGATLVVLGSTLIGVGLGIKAIGFALSGVVSAFNLVTGAIALLMNPVVFTIVAIGALAAAFIVMSGNGGKVLSFLRGKFNELADTAQEAFGGIADALAAGDIALAAQILWTALKLAWTEGTQELQNKWIEFKGAFTKVAIEAFYGVLESWAIVKAGLMIAWAESAKAFGDIWSTASSTFVNVWHAAVSTVGGWFSDIAAAWEKHSEKARINADLKTGKITQGQADKQLQDVDNQADSVKAAQDQKDLSDAAARDKAYADAKAQREQELQGRLAEIRAQRDKTIGKNVDDESSHIGETDANTQKQVDELDKKRKDLEQQLAALRGNAQIKKQNKQIDDGLDDYFSLGDASKRQGMDSVLENQRGIDLKSQGTFNAAAIQTLQGSDSPLQERIANATEKTAKAVEAIAQKPQTWG